MGVADLRHEAQRTGVGALKWIPLSTVCSRPSPSGSLRPPQGIVRPVVDANGPSIGSVRCAQRIHVLQRAYRGHHDSKPR